MPTWKTLAVLILAPFLQEEGTPLKMPWGRIELKPEALLLYIEAWPADGKVSLPRLNNPIGTVYLVNDSDKTPLGFQPNLADWSVSKPKAPVTGPQVVCVEVKGKPRIAGDPVVGEASDDGSITLPAHHAVPHGKLLRYEPQPHKNTVGYWADETDWVEWKFRVAKPGRYAVQLLQGCGKGQGGSAVKVVIAGQTLDYTVEDTGHFQNFVERPAGTVAVEKAGDYTLELRAAKKAKGAVMDVRQVKLVPVPPRRYDSPMLFRSGFLWLCLPLLAAPGPQQDENWPRFRGPTGQGLSSETGLPVEWNATTNILWKTPLSGEGWSSPIVWVDRVFLTSTTEGGTRCHVLSVDRKTGKILWDKVVFDQVASRKEGKNSYATPTPCTDGDRVCAVFGDGSAVGLDFEGNVLWTNREVQFYSRHGLGASPLLHDGLLIMPYDGSNRVPAAGQYPKNSDEERLGWQIPWDKSEIVALDAKTGKRSWTATRGKSRIAHATPVLIREGDRDLLLSIAGDVVQVFDPKTGERIWSVYCQGEGLVPSPVTGNGLIYAASGFEKTTLRAIKGGGKGDLPASAIVWEQKKGVPTQPSLLYVEPHLYAVTEGGVASCFKAATGEVVWQERIADKQTFSASPFHADGKIYLLSETGETTVIAAAAEFKVLAKNALQEKCQASIAVSRGNLFIRSDKNLYCIGTAR